MLWIIGGVFAAFSRVIVGGVTRHAWGLYPFAGSAHARLLLVFFAVLVAQVVEGVPRISPNREDRRSGNGEGG
jgi:hypothetical protein